MIWKVSLLMVVGVLYGSCLPQRGSSPAHQSKRDKRQIAAWVPLIALPPIYQVHQIILVQPPCQPQYPPTTAAPPTDDGLVNRFGEGNETAVEEPSKCVWSIVACCAPGSRNIRYSCFELLGCPGAFWDVNPCDERVVTAAANTALKYYERNSTDSRR